jgi:hypothetical protein
LLLPQNAGQLLWSWELNRHDVGKVVNGGAIAQNRTVGAAGAFGRLYQEPRPATRITAITREAFGARQLFHIAAGLKRYGFSMPKQSDCRRDFLVAKALFQYNRCPELFMALVRQSENFPCSLCGCHNIPLPAWGSSEDFVAISSILGLKADATQSGDTVSPDQLLPDWLPDSGNPSPMSPQGKARRLGCYDSLA